MNCQPELQKDKSTPQTISFLDNVGALHFMRILHDYADTVAQWKKPLVMHKYRCFDPSSSPHKKRHSSSYGLAN